MAVRAVTCIFLLLLLPPKSSSQCLMGNMSSACMEQGHHNQFCNQKISPHCHNVNTPVCHNTLNELLKEEDCSISRYKEGEGCGILKPGIITSPEESLIYLRLYHHFGNWGSEGLINMTFPSASWNNLRFQYKFLRMNSEYSCRFIQLFNPVSATLMYNCHIKMKDGNDSKEVLLTVQSDNGEGASYLFRIPPGYRINPKMTCPTDWSVFFYIHQDAIMDGKQLPVTIQSSPFGQVAYKVAVVRCAGTEDEGDEDKVCQDFEELSSVYVTKNMTDDLWTVYLPEITTGGKYMVRVQIVSDWCPPQGCHVSVSPTFEIISKLTWPYIMLICMTIPLIPIVVFILYLWKRNRNSLRNLRLWQPTVLLAYHPESQASLHFVSTFASFLENTCCVHPLMADKEAVSQDPIQWTKTEMTNASRVLFIIPKDSEAQSVTIMRNLWKVSLNHCSGDEFTTSQDKKVAKLLLPTSGCVPWQIGDVRRFELNHHPAALATWLHCGSQLDQILWWWYIKSSTTKNITPIWKEVQLAANEMESPVTLNTTVEQTPTLAVPQKDATVVIDDPNDISYSVRKDSPENSDSASDNGITDFSEDVFDPCINDGDSLWESQQGSKRKLSSCSTASVRSEEELDIYS